MSFKNVTYRNFLKVSAIGFFALAFSSAVFTTMVGLAVGANQFHGQDFILAEHGEMLVRNGSFLAGAFAIFGVAQSLKYCVVTILGRVLRI